jgi:hypothetical protein
MSSSEAVKPPLECLRCRHPMEDLGWRNFESSRVGKLLSGNIELRLHKCSACGHVEFFVESEGERVAREKEEEKRRAQDRFRHRI